MLVFSGTAFTFYNIFHFLHFYALRQIYGRNLYAFKAECLSALRAGEMNMPFMMPSLTTTDTILLETRTIADFV